jgi:hypothetical protein
MYGDLIQGAADRIAADQANGDLMLIDGEQANMAFLSGKLGLRERPHQHGRRCDSGLLLVLNIAHDLRVVGDPSQHYP